MDRRGPGRDPAPRGAQPAAAPAWPSSPSRSGASPTSSPSPAAAAGGSTAASMETADPLAMTPAAARPDVEADPGRGRAIRRPPTSAASARELTALVAAAAARAARAAGRARRGHVRGPRRLRGRGRAARRGPARAGRGRRATRRPRRPPRAASPRRAPARARHAGRRPEARHRAGHPGAGRRPRSAGRDDRARPRRAACAPSPARPPAAIEATAGAGRGRRRAAVAPDDPDDELVDGVLVWSTVVSDRHRLRDRMRELRIAPWADATGEGTALRMAASRAALGRLVAATTPATRRRRRRTSSSPRAASGRRSRRRPSRWPSSTCIRRPGASQFALDHARLLGPLGAIPDAGERRAVMADLVDDLLVPLGSVVTPAGPAGRVDRPARLAIHADGGRRATSTSSPAASSSSTCRPARPPSPSSSSATPCGSGRAARHFAVDVAGGLGGLLVDLRDVPLRLPERADRRRDLLAAWQAALWARRRRRMTDDDRPRLVAPTEPRRLRVAARPSRSAVGRGSRSRARARPGDRPLVAPGESVVAGAPIAERLRDARLGERAGYGHARPGPRRPRRRWASCCTTGAAAGASAPAT